MKIFRRNFELQITAANNQSGRKEVGHKSGGKHETIFLTLHQKAERSI